jgi:hypothetical protein
VSPGSPLSQALTLVVALVVLAVLLRFILGSGSGTLTGWITKGLWRFIVVFFVLFLIIGFAYQFQQSITTYFGCERNNLFANLAAATPSYPSAYPAAGPVTVRDDAIKRIGILTSYSGPQCTATLVSGSSYFDQGKGQSSTAGRSVIITAAHCVVCARLFPTSNTIQYTNFLFVPNHTGANPRYSQDWSEPASQHPFGIWKSSSPAIVDPSFTGDPRSAYHDVAFVVLDPDQSGRSLEKAMGGGLPLSFGSHFGSPYPPPPSSPPPPSWTLYAYDVDYYAMTTNSRPNGLHSCTGPVYGYRSSVVLVQAGGCNIGTFSSGAPWLDGANALGVVEDQQGGSSTDTAFSADSCCEEIGWNIDDTDRACWQAVKGGGSSCT